MSESLEGSEGSEIEMESLEGSVTSQSSESSIDCPKCDETFDDWYNFMKHLEDVHVRRRRR